MRDMNGLLISTDSSELIENINVFLHNMVSNGTEAVIIFEAAKKHPDNLLTQCYAGSLYLYGQTIADTKNTKQYLAAAKKQLKNSNQREQLIFHAITAWTDLDFALAIKLLTKITRDYPRDLLSAKYAEWLFFLTGQKYNANAMLTMCEAMAPHYNNDPCFYSTHSFALELSGRRQEAINMANRAIDIEKVTPWAHHTLAHSCLLMGEIEKGRQVLQTLRPTWNNIVPTLKGHNNWHLGLMHIAARQADAAMSVFHDAIWGNMPETVLEQCDAISFLWRMDMAGLDYDQSWQDIFTQMQGHANQAYTPFNSMHFIYACARANELEMAKEILDNAEKFAKQCNGVAAFTWQTAGLPVIKATHAFAKQQYDKAIIHLQNILNDAPACGGSDAQIAIVQEMYCIALSKIGQKQKARQYFDSELSFYRECHSKCVNGLYYASVQLAHPRF